MSSSDKKENKKIKRNLLAILGKEIKNLKSAKSASKVGKLLLFDGLRPISEYLWPLIFCAMKDKLGATFNPYIFFYHQLTVKGMIFVDPFESFLATLRNGNQKTYQILYCRNQQHQLAIHLERTKENEFNAFIYDPPLIADWMARALFLLYKYLPVRDCFVVNFSVHKSVGGCQVFNLHALSVLATVENLFELLQGLKQKDHKEQKHKVVAEGKLSVDSPAINFELMSRHFMNNIKTPLDMKGLLYEGDSMISSPIDFCATIGGSLWDGWLFARRQAIVNKMEEIFSKITLIDRGDVPHELFGLVQMSHYIDREKKEVKGLRDHKMRGSLFAPAPAMDMTTAEYIEKNTVIESKGRKPVNMAYRDVGVGILQTMLNYIRTLDENNPMLNKIRSDQSTIRQPAVWLGMLMVMLAVGAIFYYSRPDISAEENMPFRRPEL